MIDFKDRVVLVTGAGGGIGREHAAEFGRRGAQVVVNDLGSNVRGEGSSDLAAKVAAEINTAGGQAVSNNFSVDLLGDPECVFGGLLVNLGVLLAVFC